MISSFQLAFSFKGTFAMKFDHTHTPDHSSFGAAAKSVSAVFYRRRAEGLNVQFIADNGSLDEWSFADVSRRDAFISGLDRECVVSNNHFDGTVHEVPFEKGQDFITRSAQILDALIAAGHSLTSANCIVERAAVGEAQATTIIRKVMT
jgi:hypothetical protein